MERLKNISCAVCMMLFFCLLSFPSEGQAEKQSNSADVSDTGITPSITSGELKKLKDIPEVQIAPGVTGRIFWSKGVLVNRMILDPGAQIPRETFSGERIMVVMKGSVEQLINGAFVSMTAIKYQTMTPLSGNRERNNLVYLAKDTPHALKAGEDGAEIIEVYSPVRLDYLKKAGVQNLPDGVSDGKFNLASSIKPGKVYNLHDIQFTQLDKGAFSRLIWGKNAQLGFMSMQPGYGLTSRGMPEEELMIVLRGTMNKKIGNRTIPIEKGDILLLPPNTEQGGNAGDYGCDVLEVFQPVRSKYVDMRNKKLAAYRAIVPEEAEIELVADGAKQGPGLIYCEGPSWINGKLYFSSMGYDERWTGDPSVSTTVEMDPDGAYRYISKGIETNGTFPLHNGNLAVCDTFGHRVIEMTTKGEIVRTIADKWDGKRLDGPNDITVDKKGGIYFTDPQILPSPFMQPGKSVFYVT
ncbi:MAG: SMP-30/gluconolactonase/LRE family protein, partial [Candidatus Latescibacterota bacterium]